LEVPLDAAEGAVLGAVEHNLLRVEVLETALAKALDMLRPAPDTAEGHGHRIRDELARLGVEVGRLASAIAVGGDLSALVTALQEREQRRARLLAELASVANPRPSRDGLDLPRVLEDLRGRLTDWQGLLRQEAPQGRQALSALLSGRLVFTPREDSEGRYYEFAGQGSLGKVLAGLALPTKLVPRG
jgi:hypothetical protein